ncbi:Ankyrin repeat [Melia azedarach]|uniref:Ankyrin repeat n=1 Tax=Melia azedarach TaxID=155640 RepID=A0ACC1Y3K3_MELAZ|nr:Ankyrin repeat [Melia azedarach]
MLARDNRVCQSCISSCTDMAFDLLKRHPMLARDNRVCKSFILEKLAKKSKGFASRSRLGYWQRFIYHCIPVKEERIHDCPQTQKNDFSLPEVVDGDTEHPIRRSQNSVHGIGNCILCCGISSFI